VDIDNCCRRVSGNLWGDLKGCTGLSKSDIRVVCNCLLSHDRFEVICRVGGAQAESDITDVDAAKPSKTGALKGRPVLALA
jgi:hypothetical protein